MHILSTKCEAVLLIDANNAFNSLNREAALHNIQILCPSFATILINKLCSHRGMGGGGWGGVGGGGGGGGGGAGKKKKKL